ncbi:hypothetical protein DFJ74DRAFT_643810 [Hyaloraphidium curvatum]|nr:hypothetical protein DFJ74DRAFT_643810 [Hyaloraphidium curvatum]
MSSDPSPPLLRVGWLGLGAMGHPQAKNILARYPPLALLTCYDVDAGKAAAFRDACAAVQRAAEAEVRMASSPGEVVDASDVVFTMLPSPAVSREVYASVLGNARPGQVFVECSTVGPKVVAEIAAMLEGKGAALVDSPVSGGDCMPLPEVVPRALMGLWLAGVQGAEQATLTFIVGTADSPSLEERSRLALDQMVTFSTPELDRIRPLLQTMGKNIFHCGPIGAGQVAKLANNNLIYTHVLALSYSLISGSRHGVPPPLLSAIINTSTGRSFMSTHWNPDPGSTPEVNSPAKNGYVIPPGFPVVGAVKDVSLGLEMGELVGVDNQLVKETLRVFKEASKDAEYAGLDFSVVYKWLLENLNKL